MKNFEKILNDLKSIQEEGIDNWTTQSARECQKLISEALRYIDDEYELKEYISSSIWGAFSPMANSKNKTLVKPFPNKMVVAIHAAISRLEKVPPNMISEN